MDFEKRLAEIQLTPTQRMEAAAALRRADAAADGLIAAARGLRRGWSALAQSILPPRRHHARADWGVRRAQVGPCLDD